MHGAVRNQLFFILAGSAEICQQFGMSAGQLSGELEELRKKMAENEQQLARLLLNIEDLEGASDAALRTVEESKQQTKHPQSRQC